MSLASLQTAQNVTIINGNKVERSYGDNYNLEAGAKVEALSSQQQPQLEAQQKSQWILNNGASQQSNDTAMGNILINNNYGNNFTVQAGATVVAGGPRAAMMREQMFDSQEKEAGTQDLVTTDEGSTQGTDVDGSNHFAFEAWAQKPTEERMKFSIETMKGEKCPLCKNNYFGYGQAWQYAYVFELLRNGDEDLPRFNKVKSSWIIWAIWE